MQVRGVSQICVQQEHNRNHPSYLLCQKQRKNYNAGSRSKELGLTSNSRNTQQQIFGSPKKTQKSLTTKTEWVTSIEQKHDERANWVKGKDV